MTRPLPPLPIPFPLLAIALLLLASWLRLHNLGVESFWYDELITATCYGPEYSWLTGLRNCLTRDYFPPLYPTLVHLATLVAGTSEADWRLPSAVAGILAVAAPLLAKPLNHYEKALFMLLLGISPGAVYYSQEARAYSLFLLWSTLAVVLAANTWQAREQGEEKGFVRQLALLGLALLLAVYTHYFGVVLTIALLTPLFFQAWRHQRGVLAVAGAGVALALLFLPWYLVQTGHMPHGDTPLTLARTMIQAERLGGLFFGNPFPALLLSLLFLSSLLRMPVSVRTRLILPLLAVVTALLTGLALGLWQSHLILDRYFIFLLPMGFLALAQGLTWQGNMGRGILALAVATELVWFQGYILPGKHHLPHKPEIRQAAARIIADPRCHDATLFIYPHDSHLFRYYLNQLPIQLRAFDDPEAKNWREEVNHHPCPVKAWVLQSTESQALKMARKAGWQSGEVALHSFWQVQLLEKP